ncbi:pilus assembly protein N-terminal domain-containing protein, partial [bacterium]|nr:pilus assembly protein N-terminal domain-containing protein [bacterium]
MKKIIWLLSICLSLFADDIVVFENEYKVLELEKKVKKIIVGNQELINISLLNESSSPKTLVKLFGKKSGNTSILVVYRDETIGDFHIYVNQNLGYLQKMINTIEPNLRLSKVGNTSTVISGTFNDPHQKTKIMNLLVSGGVDAATLMDLTQTKKVNKMIRTKLYLVEVNNNKAKELGGVTGIGIFSEYTNLSINPDSITGATFSGFLLDHTAKYTASTGASVVGTLKFLEEKGVATILDDTVLITTEENNASFHVGGEVYIPIGLTQNSTGLPTIQLEEKEYGLRLTLKTKFMEKDDFMHMDIQIKDSEFDTNHEHDVKLGENTSVPSFISKNIDTDIVAKSQQVIVLGGRLHTEELNYEDKVPFLGDIPLFGELFKSKKTM